MSQSILPPGERQFSDANGRPYVGGKVYFYIQNTLTPRDTYQDADGTILNTNPVILDAAGRAVIWGTGVYRQILKDALNNTIWDKIVSYNDGISGGGLLPHWSQTYVDQYGGYPQGALLLKDDDSGYWFNTVEGNTTDPDGVGALGWVVDYANPNIDIRNFGAIGDGVERALSEIYPSLAAAQAQYPFVTSLSQSIDWAAWTAAIEYLGSIGRGTLYISDGEYISTSDNFVVDKRFITVKCDGWLVDSTVHVGIPYSEIGEPGDVLPTIEFSGYFKMKCTDSSDTRTGVELQYARNVKVGGDFYNYHRGVHAIAGADGEIFGQMVARLGVKKANFYNCNYSISSERNTTDGSPPTYQFADWSISDILSLSISDIGNRTIRNISLEGVDGISIDDAYLFMPDWNKADPVKEQNVHLELCTNITLGSNIEYFEAGLEAILLHKCNFAAITGGVIQFPGQRVPSDAIAFTGGDPSGANFVCSYVGGITGFASTKNFVGIYDNAGYIQVAPNQFRSVGSSIRYYGTDPIPSPVYGVFADTGTNDIVVALQTITGNLVASSDAIHLLGTNSLGSYVANGFNTFTGPIVADSFRNRSNTLRGLYWGASINGVITANPGSLALREAGGNNVTGFLKISGSGNTGWEAIATNISNFKTYDPASIADGAFVSTTVTVTGASLGGFASASFSLDLQGIILSAWVNAADTVTVKFSNNTGSTIDLASGTLRARVSNS